MKVPLLVLVALLSAPRPAQDEDLPMDFRCDGMQVYSKENRNVCKDNVVVRRPDLLLCCDVFEGFSDAKGNWERFVCTDNVRAQRGDELMWSHKGEFLVTQRDLVLTGLPILMRGKSLLVGDRVVVNTRDDHARIHRPHGFLATRKDLEATPPQPMSMDVPLPPRCPLPPAPTGTASP